MSLGWQAVYWQVIKILLEYVTNFGFVYSWVLNKRGVWADVLIYYMKDNGESVKILKLNEAVVEEYICSRPGMKCH